MKTYRRYKLTMPSGDVTYHRTAPDPCTLPMGADLRVDICKVDQEVVDGELVVHSFRHDERILISKGD